MAMGRAAQYMMAGAYGVRSAGSGIAGGYAALGRGVGAAGRTALMGAGAGGLYGAMADDTSVIGGALIGAGAGLAGRYGRAGIRHTRKYLGGQGATTYSGAARGFGGAVSRRFMRDVEGVSMRANRAINSVGSTLKGWGASPMNAYGRMF